MVSQASSALASGLSAIRRLFRPWSWPPGVVPASVWRRAHTLPTCRGLARVGSWERVRHPSMTDRRPQWLRAWGSWPLRGLFFVRLKTGESAEVGHDGLLSESAADVEICAEALPTAELVIRRGPLLGRGVPLIVPALPHHTGELIHCGDFRRDASQVRPSREASSVIANRYAVGNIHVNKIPLRYYAVNRKTHGPQTFVQYRALA